MSNLRDEGDGIKTITTHFAKSESDLGVIAFATRDDFKRSWIFKSRDALMWWTLGDKGLLPAVVIECQLPRLAFGVQHFARNGLLEDSVSPRRISALVNLWGLSLVTPFGIWQPLHFDFAAVSINLFWLLLSCSLAASMWTVWLRMTGVRHVPASRAGVFTVMLPITTAAGLLVLGEAVNAAQLAAFALALVGLLLATWPQRYAAPR